MAGIAAPRADVDGWGVHEVSVHNTATLDTRLVQYFCRQLTGRISQTATYVCNRDRQVPRRELSAKRPCTARAEVTRLQLQESTGFFSSISSFSLTSSLLLTSHSPNQPTEHRQHVEREANPPRRPFAISSSYAEVNKLLLALGTLATTHGPPFYERPPGEGRCRYHR